MKVDRAKAVTNNLDGQTFYFCSQHCLHAFEADPDQYLGENRPIEAKVADHVHRAHHA